MVQHREHVGEHESDDTHSVQDGPFFERQLLAHIKPTMEDEQTPLELATGMEQTYVQAASREVVFANTCLKEMLEYDRTVLQEIGGLEEHRASYQSREVAMHPYLVYPLMRCKQMKW